MNLVSGAVEQGLNLGAESVFADACDGYDDPAERCPLSERHGGCVCLRVRRRRQPWWRRWLAPPDNPIEYGKTISLLVEYQVTDGMMRIPSPTSKERLRP